MAARYGGRGTASAMDHVGQPGAARHTVGNRSHGIVSALDYSPSRDCLLAMPSACFRSSSGFPASPRPSWLGRLALGGLDGSRRHTFLAGAATAFRRSRVPRHGFGLLPPPLFREGSLAVSWLALSAAFGPSRRRSVASVGGTTSVSDPLTAAGVGVAVPLSEPQLAGELRALGRVGLRDHGVVTRQAEFFLVAFGRHALKPEMTLQRLVRLAVDEADEMFRRHRLPDLGRGRLRARLRLRLAVLARLLPHGLVNLLDQIRQALVRNRVVPDIGRDDLRRECDRVLLLAVGAHGGSSDQGMPTARHELGLVPLTRMLEKGCSRDDLSRIGRISIPASPDILVFVEFSGSDRDPISPDQASHCYSLNPTVTHPDYDLSGYRLSPPKFVMIFCRFL